MASHTPGDLGPPDQQQTYPARPGLRRLSVFAPYTGGQGTQDCPRPEVEDQHDQGHTHKQVARMASKIRPSTEKWHPAPSIGPSPNLMSVVHRLRQYTHDHIPARDGKRERK